VVNREVFLFQVEGEAQQIVKIVYEHGGYSDIPAQPAEKPAVMLLKAHRDRSCDEDYRRFVSEAPVFESEDKTISTPAIKMLGEFNGLTPSYKLKCYRLGREGVQIDAPTS
jgi:hypothetical protein